MENSSTPLPRVTIQFCTQCKWMLRAAYFAQELLSTFSTSLGEVALQPSTGGIFVIHLYHASPSSDDGPLVIQKLLLWDRKAEGGFPETKELKKRVRNIIDPTRDLGHVDGKESPASNPPLTAASPSNPPHELVPQPILSGANTPTEEGVLQSVAIPTPPYKLHGDKLSASHGEGTGNITFMGMDADSKNASAVGDGQQEEAEEVVGANGKIKLLSSDGEAFGFCRPGDEDCG